MKMVSDFLSLIEYIFYCILQGEWRFAHPFCYVINFEVFMTMEKQILLI